jgi:LuxR family maltose regulon positive regulatory protein
MGAFQVEEQGPTVPDLKKPLTRRELQTLRLLKTDLSPQEIASQMTISDNTVRTHIKNIYRKLGVHGRFEAVQRAEEFSLL